MAGLFVKDLRLLMQRKQSIILFLGIALIMGFTMDGSFIMGYLPLLFAVLSIGTISFDEADNGYPFLMSLPIKRSDYVKAKYIFCFLGALCGWVMAIVIYFIANRTRGVTLSMGEELMTAAMFIPLLIIVCSILIALQLKFGAEKSRIILLMFYGIFAVLAVLGSNLLKNTDPEKMAWIKNLDQVSGGTFVAAAFLLSIITFVICYLWSVSFMNKKEY